MSDHKTPKRRRSLNDVDYLASLLSHPYTRIPDFLKGGIYDQLTKSTYDNTYLSTLHLLEIPIPNKEPLWGLEFIEYIEPYYKEALLESRVTDPEMDWEEQVRKYTRLTSKQLTDLPKRIKMIEKALKVAKRSKSDVREQMFADALFAVKDGIMPNDFIFQRTLFRAGYSPTDSSMVNMIESAISRINMVM